MELDQPRTLESRPRVFIANSPGSLQEGVVYWTCLQVGSAELLQSTLGVISPTRPLFRS